MLYRQYTLRIRFPTGPSEQLVSTRPHHEDSSGRRVFDDSDDEPTLIELSGEEPGLNIEALLSSGAIAPYDGPLEEPQSAETLGLPTSVGAGMSERQLRRRRSR